MALRMGFPTWLCDAAPKGHLTISLSQGVGDGQDISSNCLLNSVT